MEDSLDPTAPTGAGPMIKLRSYQQEMLDASLTRNVIVALETGSGKTQIAVYRILAELERTDSSKLVWFVAPKVALAEQQFSVLVEQLPAFLIKKLLGYDNVDKWTEQSLWDATLANVRAVVSTPAVLADALYHGFVAISKLSLLIFDEAHNCIGKSPMNRIMQHFYHPAKDSLQNVPHVLGLFASPVISAKSASLDKLETSLDATAVTPKHHRSDLTLYVRPPEAIKVTYASPSVSLPAMTPSKTALDRILQSYDFHTDPYVIEQKALAADGDAKSSMSVEKAFVKRKTWCYEQLSAISRRAESILNQLGPRACEWYIAECRSQTSLRGADQTALIPDVSSREKAHVSAIMQSISESSISERIDSGPESTTPKAEALVATLLQHVTAHSTSRTLIFAEERAVVLALCRSLRAREDLATSYEFATFLGTSMLEKRKTAIADLDNYKQQSRDLDSFRTDGKVNVMVSTSVLEEGIDISACNPVICFDLPKNLVQFVQRRGRARQERSKYIMMVSQSGPTDTGRWDELEKNMKEYYSDDSREHAMNGRENIEQGWQYRVSETGAMLDLDSAKAHLHHFRQASTRMSRYVDARPEFSTERSEDGGWRAEVTLPSFVHPSMKNATSADTWSGEANAVKDAAMQAYIALHKGGLVNDNLLPYTQDYGPNPGQVHVDQPSLVTVSEMRSSWQALCHSTLSKYAQWYPNAIELYQEDGEELVEMKLFLPTSSDIAQDITLYWNQSTRYRVRLSRLSQETPIDAGPSIFEDLQSCTDQILRLVHASRMKPVPDEVPFLMSSDGLRNSLSEGRRRDGDALDVLQGSQPPLEHGLVRVEGEIGQSYFFLGVCSSEETGNEPSVTLAAFPKRRDFLHALDTGSQNDAHTAKRNVPTSECTVDAAPAKYSLLAAFLPSILHRISTNLLAADLHSSILAGVPISDRGLLVEAISSPSAREASDYNRLEFLGDCVLKFCATLHVMAKHPTWPEGYLTLEKSRVVSNNALAKAALCLGLDKYIITNHSQERNGGHPTSTKLWHARQAPGRCRAKCWRT